MTYAQVSDVTVRWARTATPEESELIETRLEDAERKIRKRITDFDDRVAADPDYEADVIQIEADAVLRLVRNPEGFMSETDGTYTYMLQNGTVSGALSILPEEWELLGVRESRFAILAPRLDMPT